jgi:hypothetical protein
MEQKLRKIFQKAKYENTQNLADNIWSVILLREKQATRFKLWAFTLAGFASLAGAIPAIKALSSDLVQSGFYEYFSLIFSDGGSVISHWKEFVFSIAESLPTMSIIISLSFVLVFFLSLKYATKQIIKGQLSPVGFSPLSF